MDVEYSTIAVNRTPTIDPGDTIEIDLYWSGNGVPDKNRLYLNYNRNLVNKDNTGEIRTFVKKAVDTDTGEVFPVSGTEHMQKSELEIPGTEIGFVETLFHPDSQARPDHMLSGVISESDHEGHSPVEVRINTAKCPPGEYSVAAVFNYQINDIIKQDRVDIDIHVNTWSETHRRKLEIGALIGVIASIGILATSIGL